ncbi:hypothetical protein JTE90_005868 [Oedothorax gibbosus]|uniref:Uncharacterized protein n=1 Tax=Oedothorax gibbosus TaxID=931172 RepID=A0AAV6UPY0_9ARAC|nr:hypothetical protein JTE90_005868 [Oedothorax gibbosus]
MNWMGGARSRIKAISTEKKQREFFEKRRRSAFLTPSSKSPISVPALSQDLISFHLSQRNLLKKSQVSKPTVVIRQDLNNRAIYDVDLHMNLSKVNLDQPPVSKNGLPKVWKMKQHLTNVNSSQGSIVGSNKRRESLNTSMLEEYQIPSSGTPNAPQQFTKSNDLLNQEIGNASQMFPKSFDEKSRNIPTNGEHGSQSVFVTRVPRFPPETPDIHEAFKKHVYINKMSQPQKDIPVNTNSDEEYKRLQKLLKQSLKKDMLHLKSKHGPLKKSRFLESMNSTLSRKENEMANNPKFSYSDLSKCTFESMPRKVNRNAELEDEVSKTVHSELSDHKSYRDRMHELEEMIAEARHINSKESMSLSDCGVSPIDSTSSSSSSGNNIPVFFQRKRKLGNGSDDHSFTSIKKIKRSISDSKSVGGIADGLVNHHRKIKISDTTVLNSMYAEEIKKSNIIKTIIDSKVHVEDLNPYAAFSENVCGRSFFSGFVTPDFKISQYKKSESSSKKAKNIYAAVHKYKNSSNFRTEEENDFNYSSHSQNTITNSEDRSNGLYKTIVLSPSDITTSDLHNMKYYEAQSSPSNENVKSNYEMVDRSIVDSEFDSKDKDTILSNSTLEKHDIVEKVNEQISVAPKEHNSLVDATNFVNFKKSELDSESIYNNKLLKVDVATSPFLNKMEDKKINFRHISNNENYIDDHGILVNVKIPETISVNCKANSDQKYDIDPKCNEVTKKDINTISQTMEDISNAVNSNTLNNIYPRYFTTRDNNQMGNIKAVMNSVSAADSLCVSPTFSNISTTCTEVLTLNNGYQTKIDSSKIIEKSLTPKINTNSVIECDLSTSEYPSTVPSTPQYSNECQPVLMSYGSVEKPLINVETFSDEELPPTAPTTPIRISYHSKQNKSDTFLLSPEFQTGHNTNISMKKDKQRGLEVCLNNTYNDSLHNNSTPTLLPSMQETINLYIYESLNPLKTPELNNQSSKNDENGSMLIESSYLPNSTDAAKCYTETGSIVNLEVKTYKDADEDPLYLTPVKMDYFHQRENETRTEHLLQTCASKLGLHVKATSDDYEPHPNNPLVNNLNKSPDILSPHFQSNGLPKTPILNKSSFEDVSISDKFHPKLDATPFLLNITAYMKQLSKTKPITVISAQANAACESNAVEKEISCSDIKEFSTQTSDKSTTEFITKTTSEIETFVITSSTESFYKGNEMPLNEERSETVLKVNDIPICEGEQSPLAQESCLKLKNFNFEEESESQSSVLLKEQNFENIPLENVPLYIFNGDKEIVKECVITNVFHKALQVVPEMADAWSQTTEIIYSDFSMQTF